MALCYVESAIVCVGPCGLVVMPAHSSAWTSLNTGIRGITTFRSTTDRIYDGDPIMLQYNIIILTIVLQLPTVFSTVTCCTGL